MKTGWKLKSVMIIGAFSIVLAGCAGSPSGMSGMDHSKMNMKGTNEPQKTTDVQAVKSQVLTGKVINLTAMESNQEIAPVRLYQYGRSTIPFQAQKFG